MSSSDYLDKVIYKKVMKEVGKATKEKYEGMRAAEDSGADTEYLKRKAQEEETRAVRKAASKYSRDSNLIRRHGKQAARARGFNTNYNAKPYANKPRKPKANLD